MTEFRITKPGEYRQRNGGKAVVESTTGFSEFEWRGRDANEKAETWKSMGARLFGDDPTDLVAEWTAPFVITKPGEYVTRDGNRAVVLVIDAPSSKAANVVGYITDEKGCACGQWFTSGRLAQASYFVSDFSTEQEHKWDIVGVWGEPVAVEGWMNVYEDRGEPWASPLIAFKTKDRAENVGDKVLARIRFRYSNGHFETLEGGAV